MLASNVVFETSKDKTAFKRGRATIQEWNRPFGKARVQSVWGLSRIDCAYKAGLGASKD